MARHYDLGARKAKPPRKERPPVKGGGWVYRVVWQRRLRAKDVEDDDPFRKPGELLRPKSKHFLTLGPAIKFYRMFGPAPWRYFRTHMDPDDQWPCNECYSGMVVKTRQVADGEDPRYAEPCEKCFGGVTVREYIRRRRDQLPEIVWVRLERRPVGVWEECDFPWEEEVLDQSGETSSPGESSVARALRETLSEDEKKRRALLQEEADFPF